MDVRVEHNGDDITQYVDNYTRQSKICTGIGTLEISFVNSVARTFYPWDSIELYEEDDKKGHYYIDIVSNSIPDGLITLSCRDGCKKLMDYFIAESYLINYPSYSRDWIEQFLDEAQVNFEFNVEGNGNLLSNNTSLGNSSTYDQIIPLLQMNGWYIHFDADNKAVIGKLKTSLSNPSISVGKEQIITIKTSKNDKMLRNRVVVWGGIEEATSTLVAAEASTHTPWDYDEYDKRTSVISNSSIRSYEQASDIANMALSEFSKITFEKSLECVGGYEVAVGDFVSVSSDVYSGLGLATTVGSTLNKDGFKTNIILDERCPRLFSFFDFGDFVYVSSMGNGVWRKPIDGIGWLDYSLGLTDMSVTDLYKNSGILSAVTASGHAYYSIETTGVWNRIPLVNLTTLLPDSEGVIGSGSTPVVFSGGIAARATIHDRITNTVKIAAGSNTTENYVDYSTGMHILSSGILPRSWIVDFNPNAGAVEKSYPIHVGNFYNYDVLDIENDGVFDYVTVGTSGWLTLRLDKGVFGDSEGMQYHPPEDSKVSYSTMQVPLVDYDIVMANNSFGAFRIDKAVCTYDTSLLRGVVGISYNPANQKQYVYGRFMTENPRVFTESYEVLIPTDFQVLGIHKSAPREYTIFSRVGLTNTFVFGTVRFNSDSYTSGPEYVLTGDFITVGERSADGGSPLVKGGPQLWGVKITHAGTSSKVYGITVDLRNSSLTEGVILDCGGNTGFPNRVSRTAIITPLASGGCLIKVARCSMEVDYYGKVIEADISIVNFSGPGFSMTEQSRVHCTGVEYGKWYQNYIGIGIIAENRAVNSVANMAYAYATSPFVTTTNFVRSVFPLNPDYDVSETSDIRNITRDFYTNEIFTPIWQAGPDFEEEILGAAGGADGTGGTYGVFDFYTGERLVTFDIPQNFRQIGMLPHVDSVNQHVYIMCQSLLTGDNYLLEYISTNSDVIRYILLNIKPEIPQALLSPLQNAGGWLILGNNLNTQILYIHLFNLSFAPIVHYSVLRREKEEFKILKTDFENMRLDDSLGMPLVAVTDDIKSTSLMRNYASGFSFTNVLGDGPMQKKLVHDFKYTSTGMTSISGIVPGSGVAIRSFIYAANDGINTIPMSDSLDLGGNTTVFASDAGVPYRLETTNYKFPNQRVFTVTSGEAGNRFFQSDPVVSGFSDHTLGLPQTVITRIRVDDRL